MKERRVEGGRWKVRKRQEKIRQNFGTRREKPASIILRVFYLLRAKSQELRAKIICIFCVICFYVPMYQANFRLLRLIFAFFYANIEKR